MFTLQIDKHTLQNIKLTFCQYCQIVKNTLKPLYLVTFRKTIILCNVETYPAPKKHDQKIFYNLFFYILFFEEVTPSSIYEIYFTYCTMPNNMKYISHCAPLGYIPKYENVFIYTPAAQVIPYPLPYPLSI